MDAHILDLQFIIFIYSNILRKEEENVCVFLPDFRLNPYAQGHLKRRCNSVETYKAMFICYLYFMLHLQNSQRNKHIIATVGRGCIVHKKRKYRGL